jgi:4-hydroxybenzoate polyprenyltransferase
VASGEVSVPVALAFAASLIAGGLAWAHFGLSSWPLTGVCATYVAIQSGYSLWLKRLVIVDVLCIASGFVLRLLAGASAAWVSQSAWILICTIFVSLFLALCKRRHEVVSLGDGASGHRAILAHYPPALLDQLIGAAASATLVSYALYTVDERTVRRHGLMWDGSPSPVLAATIPFVIYGVFRYLYLVYRREEGGSPTSTLLRDLPSLVNGLLFLAAVLTIFAAFGR